MKHSLTTLLVIADGLMFLGMGILGCFASLIFTAWLPYRIAQHNWKKQHYARFDSNGNMIKGRV